MRCLRPPRSAARPLTAPTEPRGTGSPSVAQTPAPAILWPAGQVLRGSLSAVGSPLPPSAVITECRWRGRARGCGKGWHPPRDERASLAPAAGLGTLGAPERHALPKQGLPGFHTGQRSSLLAPTRRAGTRPSLPPKHHGAPASPQAGRL